MNLEQRVEALEQAFKALVGGRVTLERGQFFINETLLHDGSITAVNVKTAEGMRYYSGMEIGVTC